MKTIGLIGGMSWASTASYYKTINECVRANLGGLSSAKIIMHSVNFDEINTMQKNGDWEQVAAILGKTAKAIEQSGADFILICSNTMHKVAPIIRQHIRIPLLHIADITGKTLKANGVAKIGLLGTQVTMEQEFYKAVFQDKYGIEVIVPNEADRQLVNDVIHNELTKGVISSESRTVYLDIINTLAEQGASVVVLGSTEISLLVNTEHTTVPLCDPALIHAETAARLATK